MSDSKQTTAEKKTIPMGLRCMPFSKFAWKWIQHSRPIFLFQERIWNFIGLFDRINKKHPMNNHQNKNPTHWINMCLPQAAVDVVNAKVEARRADREAQREARRQALQTSDSEEEAPTEDPNYPIWNNEL